MRFNEAEAVAFLASRPPDWEGSLSYRGPKQSGGFSLQQHVFKERYFKLLGNLLYCLKSERGEVVTLLVLETGEVQHEDREVNSFSLTFQTEDGVEKHMFVADTKRAVIQWLEAIRKGSYERKREELILLQIKLRNKTGQDPLSGTAFANNSVYSLRYSSAEEATEAFVPGLTRRPCKLYKKNNGTGGGPAASNFTSHLGIQIWEDRKPEEEHICDGTCDTVGRPNPTFKSHIPEGNLIDF